MGGNNPGDEKRVRPSVGLGRSAVSYQNISPSADIFTGDRRNPFQADGNKSTTNVAWLVGASPGPVVESLTSHHIDITAQDQVQPPSHLAVAPITPDMSPGPGGGSGYSLARSKTISDLPQWAHGDRRPSSSPDMSPVSTLGTVSTLGSLRSKIVRHKTLLGSSSRLYKFSQSLSSLTTLGSESRAGASTSSTLR